MLARTLVPPVLPLIEDEFAISHANAAILFSLISLGSAMTVFTSGLFAGFVGYKRSILVSFSVATLLFLVVPHAGTFSQLALLFFMIGVSTGVYFPSSISVITEHYHHTLWGKTLAVHDTAAAVSLFGAPLIAIFLLKFLAWRQFFYVLAVAYAICTILYFLSGKEIKVRRRPVSHFGSILRNKSLWILAIIWVVTGGGAMMAIYLVIPLYLTKELSLSLGHANTIFGLSRVGGAIFAVIMGFVADRFDLRKSMFAVVMAVGISILFIGHSSLRVVEIALFFQGTIVAGFFPVGLTLMSRMFSADQRSIAAGVVATSGGVVGMSLFPYLFGLSGDHLSFRFGIFVFGLLVILTSGLAYFLKVPARDEVV
jgi:NNP family nitrate/nitrite transporter-like MFS transporter